MCMSYRIAPISMNLSDIRGRSSIASLLKWDFFYISAAVNKIISTDTARRAVPLRQLGLLH